MACKKSISRVSRLSGFCEKKEYELFFLLKQFMPSRFKLPGNIDFDVGNIFQR